MHVAEIPSLYIWVLKKFHGFPVSRCRIEILCIDYRALIALGWQCWQKEEVKKVLSICTCTKDNSPNSYPSFIGSIIFSLAFGLQSVSMRANALFLTCWSKSFQLRGVRDLCFFLMKADPVPLSQSPWFVYPFLWPMPSEKRGLWLQERCIPACPWCVSQHV